MLENFFDFFVKFKSMVLGISGFLKQIVSFIRCSRLLTWQNVDIDSSIGLELKSPRSAIFSYCDACESISSLNVFYIAGYSSFMRVTNTDH